MREPNRPLVAVLDDDPTGAQEVADTPVVLDWSADVLAELEAGPFHVITNSRAGSGREAYEITRAAASAVLTRFPQAEILLRGDSTLRGHVREEYEALRDVAFGDCWPVLMLVPALPSAGRVTIDGSHMLVRGGVRIPLDQTEYAGDGALSYHSARLLDWAQERSGGLFAAVDGVEVRLATLRGGGAQAMADALAGAAKRNGPVVCVPDAERIDDLATVAAGLESARGHGVPVVVRCAPAFAAVRCGTRASRTLPTPRAATLLVVCGSYVPQTTRQLARLLDVWPDALVELDLGQVLGVGRAAELARVVRSARSLLERSRLAVIATPRVRGEVADDPQAAAAITAALATLTRELADTAELVVFKGGITSAVGARDGLGARCATVEGPIGSGAALWRLADGRRCVVCPGNTGEDDMLERIAHAALGS